MSGVLGLLIRGYVSPLDYETPVWTPRNGVEPQCTHCVRQTVNQLPRGPFSRKLLRSRCDLLPREPDMSGYSTLATMAQGG